MIQILSIRTGALLITSIRIACILLFLVCLSIGTIRIVRLEAQIQERQLNEWIDLQNAWLENPQQAADHMVFGMSLEQRQKARQLKGQKTVAHWV